MNEAPVSTIAIRVKSLIVHAGCDIRVLELVNVAMAISFLAIYEPKSRVVGSDFVGCRESP